MSISNIFAFRSPPPKEAVESAAEVHKLEDCAPCTQRGGGRKDSQSNSGAKP